MNRILTATAIVAMAALTAAPAFAAAAATTATTAKPAAKTAMVAKTAMATPAKAGVITFKSLDTNHDGKISLAEIQKVWPKVTKAEFAKYDTNKDGFLDHAELAAFAKAMAPAKPSAMKPAAK